MSRPSQTELHRLRIVAGEIIATMEAHGFTVDRALSQHQAFRRNQVPSSSLVRALVLEAAERGARRAGMFPDDVAGGVEIVSFDEAVERRYRVKKAIVEARDGRPRIVAGANSTLLDNSSEPEQLTPLERWVLCFKVDDDAMVVEIFAAEIIGYKGNGPFTLILDEPYPLEPITNLDGFTPSDDDDLGEGFESDDGSGEGVA